MIRTTEHHPHEEIILTPSDAANDESDNPELVALFAEVRACLVR